MHLKITNKKIQFITTGAVPLEVTFTFHSDFVTMTFGIIEKNDRTYYAKPDAEGNIYDEDLINLFLMRNMAGLYEYKNPYYLKGHPSYTLDFQGFSDDPLTEILILENHNYPVLPPKNNIINFPRGNYHKLQQLLRDLYYT